MAHGYWRIKRDLDIDSVGKTELEGKGEQASTQPKNITAITISEDKKGAIIEGDFPTGTKTSDFGTNTEFEKLGGWREAADYQLANRANWHKAEE